jgi:hypothetical protein
VAEGLAVSAAEAAAAAADKKRGHAQAAEGRYDEAAAAFAAALRANPHDPRRSSISGKRCAMPVARARRWRLSAAL